MVCNKQSGFVVEDFVVEFLGEVGLQLCSFMFVSYSAAPFLKFTGHAVEHSLKGSSERMFWIL